MAQKGKFNIPDQRESIENLKQALAKYKLGEKDVVSLYHLQHLTPVFAFDYVSFNSGNLCFNGVHLKPEDFVGFLNGLKKISPIPYETLTRVDIYRFHKVSFNDDISISINDYKAILYPNERLRAEVKDEELPTLYQFDLHYIQKARALGFVFKGIFYLIWYDRNHEVYG